MEARLPPIERPSNPLLRLAYRAVARQFGKVITPMRVIYARKPRLLLLAAHVQRTLEWGLSLDPGLRLLIQVQASRANGCSFCEDLALAQAVRRQMGTERFDSLEEFRTSEQFSPRERAALAFTEEAVRERGVSEATFAEARWHYSETELVEIAWVAAAETYFNIQAHALGIGSDELLALVSRR
ncbi:MAG: carboxymuconolactone decarboxylase family protein [Gemmatimonadetes bacterium]|nr:carboxymuconolactone decarboxylase family protein [Gemmatimonadota bacterium]